MDLRFEAVYTNTPSRNPSNFGGQYIYWELFYQTCTQTGKTSSETGSEGMAKGFSLGASIGYVHETPLIRVPARKRRQQFHTRRRNSERWLHKAGLVGTPRFECFNVRQYEKWKAPLLAPTPQTNWTSTVAIAFWPRAWSNRFMEWNSSVNKTETAKGAQPGTGPEGNGMGISLEGTTESESPRARTIAHLRFLWDIAGYCCAPFSLP